MRYVLDPAVTPRLREELAQLWADVTNAGGAVGFVPPVTPEDVQGELRRHLVGVAEGSTRPLVGFDESGRAVATAFFVLNEHRLMRHWVWLKTVMLHPDLQGRGTGREVMAAAASAARSMDGITAIRLTCRGGMGLERFYASCGYREVGRVPDAIQVADGEFRDDVILWRRVAEDHRAS
ncbi:GNAT family N-acetyltransferase [Streptomyces sp. 4N509B]|uniref:GNAT family N-acetyltransferase n=1 Tax=Streptomyces sp. 4N509B TaxID=3457413 RepID=UPI003FD5782A